MFLNVSTPETSHAFTLVTLVARLNFMDSSMCAVVIDQNS